MIKRYGLGRKALSSLADTSVYGPEIVEMPNGEFYRCADIDPLLESIGAGGVSGKNTKTIEQHRAEFEANWDYIHSHGLDGGWEAVAWAAWKAARGLKP